jgi:uncharacterized protein YkwD
VFVIPLLVLALGSGMFAVPATNAAGDCSIGAAAALDAEERAFLVLINNHRASHGLAPLTASYTLSRASAWKSRDMGVNRYFAHDDTPIGRGWSERARDCGYGFGTGIGENIAAGVTTAQQAFDIWRNSAGHNANMLGSGYRAIGIGRHYTAGSPYGWYWTTVFGGYDDGWVTSSGGGPRVIGAVDPPATGAPVASWAAKGKRTPATDLHRGWIGSRRPVR